VSEYVAAAKNSCASIACTIRLHHLRLCGHQSQRQWCSSIFSKQAAHAHTGTPLEHIDIQYSEELPASFSCSYRYSQVAVARRGGYITTLTQDLRRPLRWQSPGEVFRRLTHRCGCARVLPGARGGAQPRCAHPCAGGSRCAASGQGTACGGTTRVVAREAAVECA
jgi:hypothetical protein